ncbi:sigma 54-interacting transcriptional regulator [Chelatococcus reniformis]|uniref:Sigma-54 factor interaction domain-containing protein n=1 Tax=Chelatococcus reniformis TaxID=1494448 RepID=A0A916XDK8_9HYPH|nr:sigma 54-interacting transcriptional regulator [Chelatococcus reniformis]GGC64000.1 hypothetical protein GCM10010994_23280 [Chelatococcus reniformis]
MPRTSDAFDDHAAPQQLGDFPARSPAMARAVGLARRAARTAMPLLIEGEPGSGKETLARAVHAAGERRARAFVCVDCARCGDKLADRFADGGGPGRGGATFYLAEAGQLSAAAQLQLVGLLEPRAAPSPAAGGRGAASRQPSPAVRLIAATSRPLIDLVRDGRFREDLYYRLAVTPITVPPLRERREDLMEIAGALVASLADDAGCPAPRIGEDAAAWLTGHAWPGNVAQLAWILRQALSRCAGDLITTAHLIEAAATSGRDRAPGPAGTVDDDGGADASPDGFALLNAHGDVRRLADIEAGVIRFALKHYDGHMSEISRRLGIGRSTLYRKLRDLGLDADAAVR